jgi:hypothetical protein
MGPSAEVPRERPGALGAGHCRALYQLRLHCNALHHTIGSSRQRSLHSRRIGTRLSDRARSALMRRYSSSRSASNSLLDGLANSLGWPCSVLSIITGGGKWIEITIPMDPLYLSVLISAEKKFWRCVQTGETPHLINAEPPRPRIETVRIVDMSSSNSWAEFAALFCNTREAFLDHERARSELKALIPEVPRRPSGMECEPNARSRARSASMS